ncbi:SRPBCC family protein [Paenibacillus sp. NEAU-GSW1]|uniref:SRPBCC family protein n=1 Tax=Paenibacillus sp. NEAU-GSW1 TaxID=2682486 RepID=UPI0012E31268|nr:SRPBCC family protein [Paenibacillus sp. NEAU-GSW1]MUT65191.1 cell division protein [Paenibacillus sp. NEAU-GSW1]
MITVRTEIDIAAPIEVCFRLARDIDVHTRTVWRHTNEKAVGGVTSGQIGAGESVTFQATHFLIRQKLTSKITELVEPSYFVDEMQKGTFKSLRHIHRFEALDGGKGTRMSDTLYIEAPLGLLGRVAEVFILKRYMRKFLEDRNWQLKKLAEEKRANDNDDT